MGFNLSTHIVSIARAATFFRGEEEEAGEKERKRNAIAAKSGVVKYEKIFRSLMDVIFLLAGGTIKSKEVG